MGVTQGPPHRALTGVAGGAFAAPPQNHSALSAQSLPDEPGRDHRSPALRQNGTETRALSSCPRKLSPICAL